MQRSISIKLLTAVPSRAEGVGRALFVLLAPRGELVEPTENTERSSMPTEFSELTLWMKEVMNPMIYQGGRVGSEGEGGERVD